MTGLVTIGGCVAVLALSVLAFEYAPRPYRLGIALLTVAVVAAMLGRGFGG